MFTGIVEEVGEVVALRDHGTDRTFTIAARMTPELRIDQSISHEGACLTVVSLEGDRYEVTAVKETLERSNLGSLTMGHPVNLERSLRIGDRLDGHLVQGHVDCTTECLDVKDEHGSWSFSFALPAQEKLLVHKGSICLNGVSLTIATLDERSFSVVVIPYTFEHTTFRRMKPGDRANVEYDVLGKYVARLLAR